MGEVENRAAELQDAVNNHRNLKEQAQRVCDSLKDAAEWLMLACSDGNEFDPKESFWAKSSGSYANIRGDERQYRLALNYDTVVRLVDEIVSAKKRFRSCALTISGRLCPMSIVSAVDCN